MLPLQKMVVKLQRQGNAHATVLEKYLDISFHNVNKVVKATHRGGYC
jgi:hypothetical protein